VIAAAVGNHRSIEAAPASMRNVTEAVGGIVTIMPPVGGGAARRRAMCRYIACRHKSRYSESMSSLRDLLSRLFSIAIPDDLLLLLRPARR
jgi:hypothetical protein